MALQLSHFAPHSAEFALDLQGVFEFAGLLQMAEQSLLAGLLVFQTNPKSFTALPPSTLA